MNKISRDKAEKMFRKELYKGTINTANTPHYNSLEQYICMLIDMGWEVVE